MDFKTINELSKEVHQNAVEHGFWENNPSDEHSLCLVISELMEAVEADRKGRHANKKLFNRIMDGEEAVFYITFSNCIKDTVEDEISDAFIRLLDLAGEKNITIESDSMVCYLVSKDKSFTENIYEIVNLVTDKSALSNMHFKYLFQNIMKLAEILGFNLEWHVRQKHWYNLLREFKHGKAY